MSSNETTLLLANAIRCSFGGLVALDGCTLALGRGQITGIIGPNGAGKTTLLNVISGLVRPQSGSILLLERDVTGLPSNAMARAGVVRTFQLVRDLGNLTVLETLLLAPQWQSGENLIAALFDRRKWWAQEQHNAGKARELLRRIGLWKLADRPSGGLSGGQKKLLEVARALLLEPSLVLLDEPGAGVSPPLRSELVRLVLELRQEGISFGIVEHDIELIGRVCDKVHVLAEGKTLVSGTFNEATTDPRVVAAYLGRAA